MARQLRAWARFCAFVATNALALAAAYFVAVEPVLDFLQEQRHQISAGVARLEQAAAAAERHRSVSALAQEDIEQTSRHFVQGDNTGLRDADLLTRLSRAAEESGVSFTTAASLPAREWNGRLLAGARVELTATTEQIADLIGRIEAGPTLLLIGRVKLSAGDETGQNSITSAIEVYGVVEWPRA